MKMTRKRFKRKRKKKRRKSLSLRKIQMMMRIDPNLTKTISTNLPTSKGTKWDLTTLKRQGSSQTFQRSPNNNLKNQAQPQTERQQPHKTKP
jgi:hypothetical protein